MLNIGLLDNDKYYLKLEKHHSSFALVLCDKNGQKISQSTILILDVAGITICKDFNPQGTGIPIDNEGQVILTNDRGTKSIRWKNKEWKLGTCCGDLVVYSADSYAKDYLIKMERDLSLHTDVSLLEED